jgi:hypothetical protein
MPGGSLLADAGDGVAAHISAGKRSCPTVRDVLQIAPRLQMELKTTALTQARTWGANVDALLAR